MSKYLLIGLIALTGCGGAAAQRSTTTTTAPATPTTPTATLVPVPADPVLAECQTAANDALTGWAFDDTLATPVVCVHAVELPNAAGRYNNGVIQLNADLTNAYDGVRDRAFRSTAAHELGHAWSVWRLTPAQQARYMALRGIVGNWIDSVAYEDYADVFALLVSGLGDETITPYIGTPGRPRNPAQFAERPTADQVATICAERLMPCAR